MQISGLIAIILMTSSEAISQERSKRDDPNHTLIEWLEGTWEGTAYQSDTDSNWTVKLEYYLRITGYDNNSVPTHYMPSVIISYPSELCVGNATIVKGIDPYKAYVQERICVDPENNCAKETYYEITRMDANTLAVKYWNKKKDFNKKEAIATALLYKK